MAKRRSTDDETKGRASDEEPKPVYVRPPDPDDIDNQQDQKCHN